MKIIINRTLLIKCREFIRNKLKKIFTTKEDIWTKKLPDDLLRLILKRLPKSDRLQCRHVCSSWRAVVDSAGDDAQMPRLLVDWHHPFYINKDRFRKRRHQILYEFKMFHWLSHSKARVVGSVQGWLIMSGVIRTSDNHKHTEYVYFFMNPVSSALMWLPSQPHYSDSEKVIASSVPRTKQTLMSSSQKQQQQQPCFVVSLQLFRKEDMLAYCAPGDKSWTLIDTYGSEEVRDIEIVDGKLYAVTRYTLDFFMVFDIHLHSEGRGRHTYSAQRLVPTLHPGLDCPRIIDHSVYRRPIHLVKDSESKELFMIISQPISKANELMWDIDGFQVLKLEFNAISAASSEHQWVEVDDFGDRALFLGVRSSRFISSGSYPDNVLVKNSIYFAFDWPGHVACVAGVFSLTNRSIKPLNLITGRHGVGDELFAKGNRTLWFR